MFLYSLINVLLDPSEQMGPLRCPEHTAFVSVCLSQFLSSPNPWEIVALEASTAVELLSHSCFLESAVCLHSLLFAAEATMEILFFQELNAVEKSTCRVRQIGKEIKYGFELFRCFCDQATHTPSFSLEWFFPFPLQNYIHLWNISLGFLTAVMERK